MELYKENFYSKPLGDAQMLFIHECVCPLERSMCESTSSGAVVFRGKFQEANAINKNRRKYGFDILEHNRKKLMENITSRGLIGELDHPTDSIIHFEKASHLITNLWWEGNVLMGEGEILDTPHGRILKSLIESGVRVGISSRGVGTGTTDSDGVLVIGENYKLITFDAVADPSTYSAYQKVVNNRKNESFVDNSIKKDMGEINILDQRNKNSEIYNVNENALVAYMEQLISNLAKEHAQKISINK